MATFKILKNTSGQYYWTLKSDKNNEVIAKSSEYYTTKINASNSINWVKANATNAKITDLS